MKEEEILKAEQCSLAKLLYLHGFRYIARDEANGLFAYVNKPTKHTKPDIYWHASGKFCCLNDYYFPNIKPEQEYPTEIHKNGNVRLARNRKAKVVTL